MPIDIQMVELTGGAEQWGRAVLVDDDAALRLVAGLALAKTGGVEVTGEATTLAEARKLLVTQRPDVLILDNDLPDGKGVDFLTEVRLLNPSTQVVLFTAGEVDVSLLAGRAAAVVMKTNDGIVQLCHVVDELRPVAAPVVEATPVSRRAGAADLIRARA